jgi:hypothetical protein
MAPFIELSSTEKKELVTLAGVGYVFDWTAYSSSRAKTVSFIANGDIAGLVEFERQPENLLDYLWIIEVADEYKGTGVAGKLLAYVGKDSLEAGFEGFVLFEAKTALYEYYQIVYHAKPVRDRLLHFDTETTLWLIKEFLEGDTDE